MSESFRPARKRVGVEQEEQRAWIGFYRHVREDASMAVEVMDQLDADPEMKRAHLALYLCCKQAVRADRLREQRRARIAHFVRWFCHGTLVIPLLALRRQFSNGGQLIVACLPEPESELAGRRVRSLVQDDEFAQARRAFANQASSPGEESSGGDAHARGRAA